MKHLKKLSVVLMITTLFSASFTSCIDTEVSPVVEAIYEAQADLIAAQTAVQNAEAAYKLAEAEYKLAMAAVENANAAYTMEEVAQLKIENDEALLVYQENQALLNIELAKLALQLDEVGATVALDYALKYRTYANAANSLLEDKADAEYDLAMAKAYMEASIPVYAQTALETIVENAKFQVELHEAEIAILQALLDDPNSLPAQITAWENRKAELENLVAAKEAEVDMKEEEAYNIIAGWDGEDDVRDNFITLFEDYKDQADDTWVGTNNWAKQIKDLQAIIDAAQAAIDDYATALTNAQTAIDDAQTDVDDAEAALGMDVAYNGYYTEDADGDPIAVGGVKYAAPANLQEELVNARIDLLDATAAHNTYESDLADLTASYNEAATALEAAQAAFDGNTYAADLLAAQGAVTAAQAAFDAAELEYQNAKVAFEADPTGSVNTDGPDQHASGFLSGGYDDIDLGEIGIHTDLSGDTYMRVDTWKETSIGSGEYVPASYYPTKYNSADLAVYIADIKTDAVAPNTNISVDGDIWIWEATGAGAMQIKEGDNTTEVFADHHFLTAGEATNADNDDLAVFVNVELDDNSTSNLYIFNVATNMLGKDDFSGRAFDIDAPTYASPNYLTLADANASYDMTPDADGESTGDQDEFTAYAVLWNAQLAEAVAQDAFDTGDDALVAAQEAFDYQKELFEDGVANLAALKATMDAASDTQDDAEEAVDNAWDALGADLAEGMAGDAIITVVAPATLTLNEVLFNAEVTLADLEACDEDCLQETIDNKQHEIDLIQPSLDFVLAKIAEMQDQYDEYMETYVPGSSTSYDNLDADLKVKYDTLMHEAFLLNQELNALDAELDYVNNMLSNTSGIDNLSEVSLEIELTILYDFSQGSYQDALSDLSEAEYDLAEFKANLADNETYIAILEAKIATLQQRYDNAAALAAKYLALMNAALAS